jgi:CHAT domain-containing protein
VVRGGPRDAVLSGRFYWSIFVEGEQDLHRAQRVAAHRLRTATRAQLAEFAQRLAATPDVGVGAGESAQEAIRGALWPDEAWDSSRNADTAGSPATQTLRTFTNPDEASPTPYAHPVYWAGFVNYGA